ncbi:MAG TPA: UDP-3-O-(3-hydroxymyristoyl)glucosamine N-acyltransferase, partial [Paracoccus sp.]|nr:UDP-3-O-(3-hydroxymyristoyl)glucosamine N-acyltransferase [Paracoccus sp. (in: a-proteobacteria)]
MALTVGELARALDAQGWGDLSLPVTGAAEPANTVPVGPEGGLIAMAMAPKYADGLKPGSMAILAQGMDPEEYGLRAAIFAPRPRLLLAGLTRTFDPGPDIAPGIHPTAVIDPTARIGAGAAIGAFVVIGADVVIGQGARIASHVSVGRGARLGREALLREGARIGHGVSAGDR